MAKFKKLDLMSIGFAIGYLAVLTFIVVPLLAFYSKISWSIIKFIFGLW